MQSHGKLLSNDPVIRNMLHTSAGPVDLAVGIALELSWQPWLIDGIPSAWQCLTISQLPPEQKAAITRKGRT